MNTEQLQQVATHHELMWRMYGERHDYVTWQQALALLQSEVPKTAAEPPAKNLNQKQRSTKGRPSPLKGRKLSPSHIAKLKKPKTEAQKAALRVPKRNTALMGRYERTAELRAKAAEKSRGRAKSPEELAKISAARKGVKHPLYKTYTFAAQHPVHGMFYGDRLQLHKQFPRELPLDELRKLALGEYDSYKGWRLIQQAMKK